MDSRSLLDSALFQLTPTRTRCDLVILAGGVSEKLASGLLEPFVSHLKTAKDQISKGGYSITLRPSPVNASWFTKATLQRFVRFVSTPELLERFVTIEREVEQIESSVPSNDHSKGEPNGASDTVHEENSKIRLQRVLETRRSVLRKEQAMAYARALVIGFDLDGINDLISFADAFGASRLSEACINFMELCKKKNQDRLWMDEIAAMQASRLELPFLGTSGITLAGEENGGLSGDSATSLGSLDLSQDSSLPTSAQMQSTDGKAQVPSPWPNHLPQYMHNFQGPVFQQMPPYQGYLFPGMQVASPYFPGNMQWPSNADDSGFIHDGEHDDHRKHKSSSRNKKKSSRGKGREDQDNSTEPSETSSETESDENLHNGKRSSSAEQVRRKNHGKKSSRKVVIRNINYITSKRDGEKGSSSEETSDEDFIDGEALKQQVEEAVGSFDRRHKSNSRRHKKSQRNTIDSSNDATDQENKNVAANNPEGEKAKDQWGAFQSLLLNDKDMDSFGLEPRSLQVQERSKNSEEGRSLDFSQEAGAIRKQRAVSNDSFIVTKGDPSNDGESRIENFETGENVHPMIKKRDSTYEDWLFSQRTGESGNYPRPTVSDYSSESPIIKSQSEGDWFVGRQLGKSAKKDESLDLNMFDGDYASTDHQLEKNKRGVLVDDSFMIQTRAFADDQPDLQLRTDMSMVPEVIEVTQYENGTSATPNDKVEAFSAHEPDDLHMVLGRDSATEYAMSSWAPEMDYENDILSAEVNGRVSGIETNASEDKLASDNKNSNGKTSGNSGTKGMGKEARSKVSNGSLSKSKSDIMSRTMKPSFGGRPTVLKGKAEKEEENRKRMEELMIQRQKRIAERSSAGNSLAASKRFPVEKASTSSLKNEKPKVQPPSQETKKPVFRSSTIDRLAAARATPKVPSTTPKPAQTQKSTLKANGLSQKNAGGDNKKPGASTINSDVRQKKNGMVAKTKKPAELAATHCIQTTDGIDDFKDIKDLHSVASIEKNEENRISQKDILDDKGCNGDLLKDTSAQLDYLKPDDVGLAAAPPVPHEDRRTPDDQSKHIAETTHTTPESPNNALNHSAGDLRQSNQMSETVHLYNSSEIEISTPPPAEMHTEPVHSRKKWNSEDNSPKAAKGFRKLLLFGRKSRTTAVN